MLPFDKINFPKVKVFRKKPEFLDKNDKKIFESEFEKFLPAVSVKILRKNLILPNGLIFKNIFVNTDQFNTPIGLKQKFKIFIISFLSLIKIKKVSTVNNLIYITNSNSHNFFHWFLDVLQKLERLSQIKSNFFEEEYLILIPKNHEMHFVKESLKSFKFKTYNQKKNELIFIKNLLFIPDMAGYTGDYRKNLVLGIRQRLRKLWLNKFNDQKINKRIFITRNNNKHRKIINEQDIYPILKDKGFSILDFDILNFENQIKHILNCEVLISSHGAALTHMLWMKEGSQVLEIREKDDNHNNCYFSLASDLNHKYYYAFMELKSCKNKSKIKEFLIDPKNFSSRFIKLFD